MIQRRLAEFLDPTPSILYRSRRRALEFAEQPELCETPVFYTTPLVGWESSTAYIDTIIALFVACAFIAIA